MGFTFLFRREFGLRYHHNVHLGGLCYLISFGALPLNAVSVDGPNSQVILFGGYDLDIYLFLKRIAEVHRQILKLQLVLGSVVGFEILKNKF